ncbi:IS4 family transposase [Labrys wisconsinensis]|jgi:Transposase DDE domain|uniref:Transposase IS4-like domain-containing protein n=1 Tax=Labrys wisconsinensis TaxID=425677 RepID=A0ABU0JMI4_9HYPH|nr:IS4 family transposase [Labrys wisconsinensis]MDQ0475493.1 hypothetical protein [Labrys wisconsinensis]
MDICGGLGYFGDARLDVVGYDLHRTMVEQPGSCVRALGRTRCGEMRFTRFLDNARVSVPSMAAAAAQSTQHWAQGRDILAIQDSSDIVLGGRKVRAAGFGPVGKGGKLGGLCLHAVLAIDAGTSAIGGLIDLSVINRTGGKVTPHRSRLPSERESHRWTKGSQACGRVLAGASRITLAADAESDIYESYASRPDNVHLLARMARDRRILDTDGRSRSLYAVSDGLPLIARMVTVIPAAPDRRERVTLLDIRFAPVMLRRPAYMREREDLPDPLSLRLVDIREVMPPDQGEPIHWRLLTTHAVDTLQQALWILGLYRRRWRIEEYFKTLKSDAMDIEAAKIRKPAAMINMVGAAALASVTIMKLKQARDGLTQERFDTVFEPTDEPLLEELSSEMEGNTQKQKNPYPIGSLARAQWVIARLGGWTGYYGKPGSKTYAKGLEKFAAIKRGVALAKRMPHNAIPRRSWE